MTNGVLFDQWFHGPTRAHLVDAATIDATISWHQIKVSVVCHHLRPQVIDSTHPDWIAPPARDLHLPPCSDCLDRLDQVERRAKVVAMIARGHIE